MQTHTIGSVLYKSFFCGILEQIIKLDFVSFNVERKVGCTNDRVSVYDGPASWAPSLGTFCGSMLPGDVISANNSLYVSFISDSSVQKKGFKIQYTALDPGKQLLFYSHHLVGIELVSSFKGMLKNGYVNQFSNSNVLFPTIATTT